MKKITAFCLSLLIIAPSIKSDGSIWMPSLTQTAFIIVGGCFALDLLLHDGKKTRRLIKQSSKQLNTAIDSLKTTIGNMIKKDGDETRKLVQTESQKTQQAIVQLQKQIKEMAKQQAAANQSTSPSFTDRIKSFFKQAKERIYPTTT